MRWRPKILLFCALQLVSLGTARSTGLPPKLDSLRDFTLLGFVAGETKFSAIEQALGPAKPSGDSGLICFVASTPDHTRVTFWPSEYNDKLDSFSVTAGSLKLRWESACRESRTVTPTMATLGGLKLGLSKNAVLARYGPAEDRGPGLIGYSSDRPLTETELKEACSKRENPATCSSDDYAFVGDIQLTFRDGKLVELLVSRGVTS